MSQTTARPYLTSSLQNLGACYEAANGQNAESMGLIEDELKARFETLDKARVLFDYHQKQFSITPTDKNREELQACIIALRTLSIS